MQLKSCPSPDLPPPLAGNRCRTIASHVKYPPSPPKSVKAWRHDFEAPTLGQIGRFEEKGFETLWLIETAWRNLGYDVLENSV